MAFITLDKWHEDGLSRRVPAWHAARLRPEPLLGDGGFALARKGSATLLSLALHSVLIWVLISRLADRPDQSAMQGSSDTGLTIIDLSGQSSHAQDNGPHTRLSRVQVTELEATTATNLPKLEWAISRISIPIDVAQPRIAQVDKGIGEQANPVGQTSGEAGSSARGDAPYDPFAGAAPLRRNDHLLALAAAAAESASIKDSGPLEAFLDRRVLQAIAEQVSWMPGSRGTVELIIRVTSGGVVFSAEATGGTAPAKAKERLRAALLGKRIYRLDGTAKVPQQIRLRPILLG